MVMAAIEETAPDGCRMSNECWLPVVGYEHLYMVSSLGRVRSLDKAVLRADGHTAHYPGRYVTVRVEQSRGYPMAHLYKDKKQKTVDVHKLVCRAFHGDPPPGHEVRHLNDIKTDNRAENLAWGTKRQNSLDAVRNGTHPMARKTRCKWGHPFDEDNTTYVKDGRRRCRACKRIADTERRAAKRQLRLDGEAA